MILVNWLKNIGILVLAGLLLVLLSPVILLGVMYVGGYWFLDWLFKTLRQDPKVEFKQLVALADSETEEDLFKNAQAYFENLINVIANSGGAEATEIKKDIAESEQNEEMQLLTISKHVSNDEADLEFELSVFEKKHKDGDVDYMAANDGDNEGLAGEIRTVAQLKNYKGNELEIAIGYDQLAAYFCIGLLRGQGKFNEASGQIWSFIEEKDVWIVKYGSKDTSELGLRSSYGEGMARHFWFDGK